MIVRTRYFRSNLCSTKSLVSAERSSSFDAGLVARTSSTGCTRPRPMKFAQTRFTTALAKNGLSALVSHAAKASTARNATGSGDRAEIRRPPTVVRNPPLTARMVAAVASSAAMPKIRLLVRTLSTSSGSSSSRPCGRRRRAPSQASSRPCRTRGTRCACRASAPSSASASA